MVPIELKCDHISNFTRAIIIKDDVATGRRRYLTDNFCLNAVLTTLDTLRLDPNVNPIPVPNLEMVIGEIGSVSIRKRK